MRDLGSSADIYWIEAVPLGRLAILGRPRSGLMAAGVLVSLGIGVAIAWQRTSQARGRPVPDTEEQRLWLGTAYGLKGPKGS